MNYLRAVSVIRRGGMLDMHANSPWSEGVVREKNSPVVGELIPIDRAWQIVPRLADEL